MRWEEGFLFAFATCAIGQFCAADAVAVEISPNSPRARAAAEAARNAPSAPAAASVSASPQVSKIRIKYREGPQAASASDSDIDATIEKSSDAKVKDRVTSTDGTAEDLILDKVVSEEELARIADGIERNPAVEYAVPEKIETAQGANDPSYASQWDFFLEKTGIRAPDAWNSATGADVVVAVLDTGIRKHADLVGNLLNGYDMVADKTRSNDGDGRDADPADPGDWCPENAPEYQLSTWHGTHVAGTVAATTNNNLGVAGVAYGAKIVPVRVLGQCGGSSFDIADGIRWAAGVPVNGLPPNPTPAKVINLSLGGRGACDADYADAIRAARSRGATVVVAAGNIDSDAANFRPANCEGVISVAATNRQGARAYFGRQGAGSNYGSVVKVAAPGGETTAREEGILSTLNDGLKAPGNDNYEYYQGTSMAAPHVAGIVALMYQANPTITPDEVLSILQSTSQPFPQVSARQCNNSTCGAGIADAASAVAEVAVRRAAQSPTDAVSSINRNPDANVTTTSSPPAATASDH